jgi:hypothetical protein
MWQEKSWAKAWTTDEEAREKACKADLVKKCVKSFTQAYAKITKDRKKAVAKQVAACKEAFKKDIASYSVTINDREITANSKQECPDPFGTEFGEEFEAAAKETITWTGEMAGQEATVTSKDDCTTTFVQECATKLYPAASTELLAHEQDHFNITNVLAGQAEAALHTLIGTFDSEVTACGEKQALTKAKKVLKANVTKLNNEYKKQLKTLKRTQDTYDLETNHGTVVEKQVEWSEKISEGLSE